MNFIDQRLVDWWTGHHAQFAALCFDIDGTLVRGGKSLAGARRLIDFLRGGDVPFILMTNDGNHSTEEKRDALRRAGIEVAAAEIVSCGHALGLLARERHLVNRKFFVMGDLGDFAEQAGLVPLCDLEMIDDCDGVIVGESNYDWESTFNAVINFFIRNPGRLMIAPNPDTYWPDDRDGICIGAGGKARFIQSVLTEYGLPLEEIIFLGKPYQPIYQLALEQLKSEQGLPAAVNPQRILMVGDSLRSDIRGAINAGFSSALVLTGITTREHVLREKTDIPNYIFPSL